MKIYTRRRRAFMLAASLAAFCVTAFAATTFLTVSPTNLQGWQTQVTTAATATPTPSVTFVSGPGTPPLGTGSAEFRIGANGNDAAQLRHPGFAGTRLPNPDPSPTPAANQLSSLGYSTYVQVDGSGGQAPYIILQIDTDGDAGIEDLLFFEPVYQSQTFCPSNPQPALVTGQWQTWDAFNGCWYSVFGTGGSGPGTNTKTLRQLSAALPTGVIANSSPSGLGGLRLVTGFGAGAWDNFVGNADAFRIGVGANDTLYNFDPTQSTPAPGQLIISEFTARGPSGENDEFVEVLNNTDTAHVVSPPDGSGGYGVAAEDGQLRCTIPFGTVIPARGHYLCANSGGYSLGEDAPPDATYLVGVTDSQGVALFSTNNPANFNAGTRLDAFGYTASPALYREGTGFPFAQTCDAPKSNVRTQYSGNDRDTDDNAADFIAVNAQPDVGCSPAVVLGAPGPQNLASPVNRNSTLSGTLFDPNVSSNSPPNRARSFAMEPNGTFGTLRLRRTITNNTGSTVTRLRLRVSIITTLNTPATGQPGQAESCGSDCADLRVLSSSDEASVATSQGPKPTSGVTLELSALQPLGGAYNSSLNVNQVTTIAPVAPGGSINVNILLGIERTGRYRFYVNLEALEGGGPPPPPSSADAPAKPSNKLRRVMTEGQAPAPQPATPQPQAQPAPRAPVGLLYVPRVIRAAPAETSGPGERPAPKGKARPTKDGDESEREAPEVDGGAENPSTPEKDAASNPPV